jgi:hypothetical protein
MGSNCNSSFGPDYLYPELAERYPNDEMFANLAEESACDIRVLEEAAMKQGIPIGDAKADDIDIPGDESGCFKLCGAF